jgi:hypothetical protein
MVRIAVSGAHSLGKSTLVNDWVSAYPDFNREEEPYRVLGLNGPYQIDFREKSTRLQNGIQLFYNIGRVLRYTDPTRHVIFDRGPIDYIAYSQYTANQRTTDIDDAFIETMLPAVRESLENLDFIAFVPKSEKWTVQMEDDGIRPVDHAYRDDVDTIFKEIYREGRYNILPENNPPRVIELYGPRLQRIKQLEQLIFNKPSED